MQEMMMKKIKTTGNEPIYLGVNKSLKQAKQF
jgi:hypothetical protein